MHGSVLVFKAPQPRSRLYTSAHAYARGLAATLLGFGYHGAGNDYFEQALERIAPGYHVVAVPMARVGIYLAIKHLIRRGQKVVLSPYTISDVVNMVLCAGGIPLFADIEEGGSCNIDANAVIDLLEIENNIGAVIVTHFYGLVCNIGPILTACRAKGIPLIEDAAQAFGASLDGKAAGALADVGIYSFGLLKNVTGFLGGAVLAKDQRLAETIRQEVQQFPLSPRKTLLKKIITGLTFDSATMPVVFDAAVYWLTRYAYLHDLAFIKTKLDIDSNPVSYTSFPAKYAIRMPKVEADIIIPQFAQYQADTKERISKAKLYNHGLLDVPNVVLPPLRTDGTHLYLHYSIQTQGRDKLTRFMTERLRDIQISHHRNCAGLSCFSDYRRDCPNAEMAANRVVYLPAYPGYRDDQVAANIETIREYFRESNACA
jgi:dTDP-4-amino-4,6-dideoxygalactose transaminase